MGGGDVDRMKENDQLIKLGVKQKINYQTNVVIWAVN